MASFIAAGTSYCTHGVAMIPMFIYYSMFGFQRIGDLIWAALDCRARGFMFGGTAGRTTLAGEGLQHQDGNSHLFAIAYPNVRSYDPAFVYESTVIILDGMQEDVRARRRRDLLHHDRQRKLRNAGDARGRHRRNHPRHLQAWTRRSRRQIAAARATLRQRSDPARSAAGADDCWPRNSMCRAPLGASPATRNCAAMPRPPAAGTCSIRPKSRASASSKQAIAGVKGPFIAASDYVRAVPEQMDPWVPGGLYTLGTDGFGRSDSRGPLRRFFEVDAESIALATLVAAGRREAIRPRETPGRDQDIGHRPGKGRSDNRVASAHASRRKWSVALQPRSAAARSGTCADAQSHTYDFTLSSPTIENMATEFKLPDLGENIHSGDVVSLLVKEGDAISPQQDVIEIETDKAVIPVPCAIGGKVSKIHVKPGQTVKIGEVLLTLGRVDQGGRRRRKAVAPHRAKAAAKAGRQSRAGEAERKAAPAKAAPQAGPAQADARRESQARGRARRRKANAAPRRPPAARSGNGRSARSCRRACSKPGRRRRSCRRRSARRAGWSRRAPLGPRIGRRSLARRRHRPRRPDHARRRDRRRASRHRRCRQPRRSAPAPRSRRLGPDPPRADQQDPQDDRGQHGPLGLHDPAPDEFRRRRHHRARADSQRKRRRLRRLERQAHVAGVRDEGRRAVAEAASDAERFARHGSRPDHLQGLRESRHRGRHAARPGRARAARRRSHDDFAHRPRADDGWPRRPRPRNIRSTICAAARSRSATWARSAARIPRRSSTIPKWRFCWSAARGNCRSWSKTASNRA